MDTESIFKEAARMFVQIPGFPSYVVTDLGEVISTKHGKWKPRKPTLDGWGYLQLRLCESGKCTTLKVHRLVLLAFSGDSNLQVNHKNGIKTDNRLENLEYVTQSENIVHALKSGLMPVGEQLRVSKLSDADAAKLLALKGSMLQREAAELFGVSRNHVSQVWSGKKRKYTSK